MPWNVPFYGFKISILFYLFYLLILCSYLFRLFSIFRPHGRGEIWIGKMFGFLHIYTPVRRMRCISYLPAKPNCWLCYLVSVNSTRWEMYTSIFVQNETKWKRVYERKREKANERPKNRMGPNERMKEKQRVSHSVCFCRFYSSTTHSGTPNYFIRVFVCEILLIKETNDMYHVRRRDHIHLKIVIMPYNRLLFHSHKNRTSRQRFFERKKKIVGKKIY